MTSSDYFFSRKRERRRTLVRMIGADGEDGRLLLAGDSDCALHRRRRKRPGRLAATRGADVAVVGSNRRRCSEQKIREVGCIALLQNAIAPQPADFFG